MRFLPSAGRDGLGRKGRRGNERDGKLGWALWSRIVVDARVAVIVVDSVYFLLLYMPYNRCF